MTNKEQLLHVLNRLNENQTAQLLDVATVLTDTARFELKLDGVRRESIQHGIDDMNSGHVVDLETSKSRTLDALETGARKHQDTINHTI